MVKKLLIDTNILFQMLKNPVQIYGYKLVVPDFILKEFLFKAKEYKIKNVDLFIEKLKKSGVEILKTNYELNKNADELLIKLAKEEKLPILTIDKKLKKRAYKEGIVVRELIKGKTLREDLIDLY